MLRFIPFILGVLLLVSQCGGAQTLPSASNRTSFVYFTGIGCPHCAKTDPVLFKEKVRHNDILIVEYEIYRESVNAPLLLNYYFFFEDQPGIPAIIAGNGKDETVSGDTPILQRMDRLIREHKGNGLTFPDKSLHLEKLRLTELPGRPKLWFRDRVAVRQDLASQASHPIKLFVLTGRLPEGCTPIAERSVALSGGAVHFRKACAFKGWHLLQN